MKKTKSLLKLILGFITLFLLRADAFSRPVKVVSSLPDLASIASAIGGDRVEVYSILKGNSNPHQVEVLPSYLMKASRADLFLKCGLSLD
jgi:zinc/manganese transport system substrate-binding protein